MQNCKYGVNRSYTLKQFSKHVREVVSDPLFVANKRAHSETISTIIEIDRYDGVLLLNELGELQFYCVILVYKLSPLSFNFFC